MKLGTGRLLLLWTVLATACGQTPTGDGGALVADVAPDVTAEVAPDVKQMGTDVADTAEPDTAEPDDADVADAKPDAKPDTKADAKDAGPDVPDVAPDAADAAVDVADGGVPDASAPDVPADAAVDAVDAADAATIDVAVCVATCDGTSCNDGCGGSCDGQPCSDGDLCTTGDTCAALACSGTPTSCDDGNVCTLDACAAATGSCDHTPDANATPDPSACAPAVCQTVAAQCAAGQVTCTPSAQPDATPCAGGKCQTGACLPAECTPATATCSGNATQLCDSLGFWSAASPCANGSSCWNGACQPQICSAGTATCAGNTRQVCDALGLAYAVTEDCGPSATVCANGACVAPICTPGAIDCGATGVRTCLPPGLSYSETACADGYACNAGACHEQICTPGQFRCVGKAVIQCGAAGLDFTTVQDCAATGQTCQAGSCVAPVCTPADNACNGAQASHCSADGLSLQQATCNAYQACSGGLCVNHLCQPGSSACWGDVVVGCDAAGLSASATPDCAASGQVCWQGACMPVICQPGDTQCTGGIPATCNAKGTGWDASVCGYGQLCLGKQCVTAVCAPNSLYCQGAVVAQCGADGQGGTAVENCAVSGKACANGACVIAACLPGTKSCDSGHLLTCKTDATGWWVDTCDDGQSCTNDGCDPIGQKCVHNAMVCEDGNPCTADTCMYGKCVGAWGDNQPCSDGDPCTPLDFCFQGQCQSHGVADVVTIAGNGTAGYVDGLESVARFNKPEGMAERADGSILIADTGNHCIRLWTPGKSVTTFAGAGFAGFMEGDAMLAQFKSPTGVAVGADGTVYVADSGNNRIRQIKGGVVSTFSGSGVAGYADGPATTAQFNGFAALHRGPDGALWAASSYYLRRIAADGSVTTFLGGAGPYQKATGALWQVNYVPPLEFAFAPDGSIFVSLYYNSQQIFRISPQNDVTLAFDADGAMVVDSHGVIWFQDSGNLYRGTTGGSYGLYGGVWSGGFADGVFTAGLIGNAARMLLTSDGTWLLADTANNALRKVNHVLGGCDDANSCTADSCQPDGTCAHVALAAGQTCTDGNSCTLGDTCGGGSCQGGALLNCGDGNECTDDACDPWTGQCAHTQSIRPCTAGDACNLAMVCSLGTCGAGPANETTRAGGATASAGYVDANGLTARFGSGLGGLIAQADGALLVADPANLALRRLTAGNDVTTWGSAGGTVASGPLGSVGMGKPLGVTQDRRGTVYFSSYDQIVRVVQGQVGLWCGGYSGYSDGACATAQFKSPQQLAFGAEGTLYVADSGNHVVRAISPTGTVTTLAGTGTKGYTDGPAKTAQFDTPRGIAVGADGSVYISDDGNLRIRKLKAGIVSTIAGGGNSVASPVATSQLALAQPTWLTLDFSGALYVADKTRLWRITGATATDVVGPVPVYSGGYIIDGPTTKAQQIQVAGTVANGDGSVEFADDRTVRHLTAYIRTCDDGSPCTADSCDAASGACLHVNAADASACDDGDACSSDDACASGACTGTVNSCDDGEACTADNCSPYTGACEHIARPGYCTDGSACTGAEACFGGSCTAKTALVVHLAGSTQSATGFADGDAWSARFQTVNEGCADAAGNVYVLDVGNLRIRRVAPDGSTTTVVGSASAPTTGTSDGPALATAAVNLQAVVCRAQGLAGFATSDGYFDYTVDPATGLGTVKKRCGAAWPAVVGGPGVGKIDPGSYFFGGPDGSIIATQVTSSYANFYYTYTAHVFQVLASGEVVLVASGAPSASWSGAAQDANGTVRAIDSYGEIYNVFPGTFTATGALSDGVAIAAAPQGAIYGLISGALSRFDPGTGLTTPIAANGTKAGDQLLGAADLSSWKVIAVAEPNRIVIGHSGELRNIILPQNVCDDGNPCTLDTCDALTAACAHTPASGSCNDGDPCTTGDSCGGGQCAGLPVVCASTQACVAGTCTSLFTATTQLTMAEQAQLNAWAGVSASHSWQRCYGGPGGSGSAAKLFSACVGKGPSYTVITAYDAKNPSVLHTFGAYQSQPWMTSASSTVNVYADDSAAFLFSLDKNAKLPVTTSFGTYAFWGFYVQPTMPGPKFGQSDLVLASDLGSGTLNLGDSYSTAPLSCLGAPCSSWFAGSTAFTVAGIEVFY